MDGEQFDNLDVRAQVLTGLGRTADAVATQAKALQLASPLDLYVYGDRLLRDQKIADARALFDRLAVQHPDAWLNWFGLAKAQELQGDRNAAKKSLAEALRNAKTPGQKRAVQRRLTALGESSK